MVIEDRLVLATVCPSHHAEHNEHRNHTALPTRERKVRLSKSVDAGRLSSSDFLLNKLRTARAAK